MHKQGVLVLPVALLLVASCAGSTNSGGSSGDDGGAGGGGSGSRSATSSASGSGSGAGSGATSSSSGGGDDSGADGSSGAGIGSSGGSTSSGSSGSTSTSSGGSSGSSSGSTSTSSGGSSGSSSGSTSTSSGSSGSDAGGSSCTMAHATCVSDNQACNVGSVYDLYDNQWNCGGNSCGPESAYGCLNSNGTVDFVVNSKQPAGNTAVLTYPAMQLNVPGTPTLSALTSVMSTFTVVPPTGGSNDWEVAYDLWFNANNANEFMVWVYNNGQTPGGNKVATGVSLGGRTYDIWWSSSGGTNGTVYFVLTTNITSGTLNLLQLFQYASTHGWLPANSTAQQFDMGVEVCSTNGKNATWTFTDYSMTVTM